MKNQYVGDVGDYGKYSMLRAFTDAGIKVGVNWYLTSDDGTKDGKFTSYLDDESMRWRCPVVFDALKRIVSKPEKSINDVQQSGIIGNTVLFFDDILKIEGTPTERVARRKSWFSKSLNVLSEAELIFMDPDNGLLENNDASKLGSEKYVLPDEVERYFKAGHNVVYYCHKGRRKYDVWQAYKSEMFNRIPEAKPIILTFHKGTQRSYIFLIHEEDFVKYRKIVDQFLRGWYRVFSEEYTQKGDVAGEIIGEAFSVKRSDGTIITIENRADGRVQVRSSAEPNTVQIVTADMFCKYLGY